MNLIGLAGFVGRLHSAAENSLKSTALPLASSFWARFLAASNSAFCDDGIPQRAIASSRPPLPLRTIGAG
jgi:hypothetical protein